MTITTTVGLTTQIKKIVVGTPVKRVTSGAFSIDNLTGVDTTGATTGSILIYNSAVGKFVANKNLEEQIINGGSY
jgi:hypothetical protein